MNPKNFPGRKNNRRSNVLDHLLFHISGSTLKHKEEISILMDRVVDDHDSVRAIRTKKYRGTR